TSAYSPEASISKVEFYNGSTLLYTDNISPYSFSWTNVPIGDYTLTAKAIYDAGNPTTSQQVHISVKKGGLLCATVYEGSNLVLQAPPGGLISAINFASFGTPQGSCGNFSIGECHAPNSKSVV